MSTPFSVNNPGISGLDELTVFEEELLSSFGTGTVKILEGSAPTEESGFGLVYVKSSDSKLYYKDDGGTEYDLTAGGSGGTGITWSEVTGTSQSASVNNGYVVNNAGQVTVTLPDTAAIGDIVRIVGKGSGGWKVAQNASEVINFGNLATTTGTGGYLESTNRYDSVDLVCITANTAWNVTSSQGNITVV